MTQDKNRVWYLTGVGDPAGLGLPAGNLGDALLRATDANGDRWTYLIEAEYAQMILTAMDVLDVEADPPVFPSHVVRALRAEWPEHWQERPDPYTWLWRIPAGGEVHD